MEDKRIILDDVEELYRIIDLYIEKDIPLTMILDKYKLNNRLMNKLINRIKDYEMIYEKTDGNFSMSDILIPSVIEDRTYLTVDKVKEFYEEYDALKRKIKEYVNNNEDRKKIQQLLDFKKGMEEDFFKKTMIIANNVIRTYYMGIPVSKEDLQSVAYQGLFKAITTYDLSLNRPFAGWASLIIRREIQRHFKEIFGLKWTDYINSERIIEESNNGDEESLSDRVGLSNAAISINREKSDVAKMGLSRFDIDDIDIDRANSFEDYDYVDQYEEEQSIVDDSNPEKELLKQELYKDVKRSVLDNLNDIERKVIEDRYGLITGTRMSYKDLAKKYGKTQSRIEQIENKALRKLRYPHSKLYSYNRGPSGSGYRYLNELKERQALLAKIVDLKEKGISVKSMFTFIRMNNFSISEETFYELIESLYSLSKEVRDATVENKKRYLLKKFSYDYFGGSVAPDLLLKVVEEFNDNENYKKKM